ncbi:DUF4255 domain-containing protein [Pannus brasiliensis CCIBt3594]|uniref:DUF4255 domain-containing protein n=1 Tax=Pannus brasiliensis CCIBt3594 TaxID=1427578 RepID=A0AAW9QS16_9CHRO
MLDVVLKFFKDELNTYLLARTSSDLVKVEMRKLVDDSGKLPSDSNDSILASIVNIEEDRVFKSQLPEHLYTNGKHIVLEPELKLNLYVMFAANFGQYDRALKYLSHVLTYFQARSSFTSDEYPALDPRVEKLTTELQSLTYEQLNQIWAFIGGKYLPSVIYKIRVVALQDEAPKIVRPAIEEIATNLHAL